MADGDTLMKVIKDYGLRRVAGEGTQLGYTCEEVETGQTYFVSAGRLFDMDGYATHVELVGGQRT